MSSRGKVWLVVLLLAISTAILADDTAKVTLAVEGFQKARSGAT